MQSVMRTSTSTVRPRAALAKGLGVTRLPVVTRRPRPVRAMRVIPQARAGPSHGEKDSEESQRTIPGVASEEEVRAHDKKNSFLSLSLSGEMDTSMFYLGFVVLMFFPIVVLPFLMPAIRAAGY